MRANANSTTGFLEKTHKASTAKSPAGLTKRPLSRDFSAHQHQHTSSHRTLNDSQPNFTKGLVILRVLDVR
eukprot:2988319-Amphidinium_carterae.5